MDLETMKCEFPHILAEFEKEIIQRWQEEKAAAETETETEPETPKKEPATVQSIFFNAVREAVKEKEETKEDNTKAKDKVARLLQERFRTTQA